MSTKDACRPCKDDYYTSKRGSPECTKCPGAGITTYTRKGKSESYQNSASSCLPRGWLSVASKDNIIALCSLVFCFGLLCMYCLYLDRKHPGFSHLPIFFAMMSLLEIAGCCWVLSDLFRLLLHSESSAPFDWTYPATQGSLFSLLAIYGISYVFNFFSSLSWTKQVSEKHDCIFCCCFSVASRYTQANLNNTDFKRWYQDNNGIWVILVLSMISFENILLCCCHVGNVALFSAPVDGAFQMRLRFRGVFFRCPLQFPFFEC